MLTVRSLPPRDHAALLVPLDLRDLKEKLDRKAYKEQKETQDNKVHKVSKEDSDGQVRRDTREPLEETEHLALMDWLVDRDQWVL